MLLRIIVAILVVVAVVRSQKICKYCNCDLSTKDVDCTHRNLTLRFNETDLWLDPITNKNIEIFTINFHDNDLGHIFPFPKLALKKVDLTDNRIIKIQHGTFRDLRDLEEIDLSNNHLMSEYLTSDVFLGPYAPEDTEPLRALRILRLSQNSLHTLHPDLFEHTDRIEILTLDSNPFSVIDRPTLLAIGTLPFLRVLDLSYTEIKILPLYFLHTPKYLTHLNISGNEITELPKTLRDVHSLEWLSISANPIEVLSEPNNLFPVMPTLKELHISNMPRLRRIEKDALSGLTNLEKLVITENRRLEFIDGEALSRFETSENSTEELWPQLKVLELQKNNLSRIDQHLVESWPRLTHIDIRYNNMYCDCENQWIVDTLLPIIEGLHEKLTYGLKCVEPVEMRGKNLTDLSHKHEVMRCLDKYGYRPERDGSILVGVLIGVLLTIPVMMMIIMVCYKKNFCGLINVSRSPADFSRSFYKRAEMNDDQYI